MSTGAYSDVEIFLFNSITSADVVTIHGQGSTLTCTGTESLLVVGIPLVLKDIRLVATTTPDSSNAISVNQPITLKNVSMLTAYYGIHANNTKLTLENVEIETTDTIGTGIILTLGSELVINRGIIKNGRNAVVAAAGTQVDISNLIVYGAREVALKLPDTGGIIQSTTIANSGLSTPTGPRGLACGGDLTVRSSIVWLQSHSAAPPISGMCTLVDVIAGNAAVPGASNSNPNFVSASTNDYHLGAGSPARDMSNVGPSVDFENDARPKGARYDIGADESE